MATLAFADVLDRKTGATGPGLFAGAAEPAPRQMPLWAAQAVWIYELGSFGLAVSTHGLAAAHARHAVSPNVIHSSAVRPNVRHADADPDVPRPTSGARLADHRQEPPSRPRRILSSAERDALLLLRSLGATQLRDNFDHADLKRAYRHLALALHPDRHMAETLDERRQRAQDFVAMTAAVDCLLAVPVCLEAATKAV